VASSFREWEEAERGTDTDVVAGVAEVAGLEAAVAVYHRFPIIALSAHTLDDVRERCVDAAVGLALHMITSVDGNLFKPPSLRLHYGW
jgi:hypothetical protein